MERGMRRQLSTADSSEMVYPEQEEKESQGLPMNVTFVDGKDDMAAAPNELHYSSEPLDLADIDNAANRQLGTRSNSTLAKNRKRDGTASYTRQNFPDFGGTGLAKPRGGRHVHRENDDDASYSTFTTRAHRTRVYRSYCARIFYTFILLNMIVWVPLWLKLMTIGRSETREEIVSLFNSSIEVELNVSGFGPQATCGVCDERDDGEFGVTYPISATIKNFHDFDTVSSASYISLLASFDFENWFTVNQPGLLTGIAPGYSTTEVCRADPIVDDDEEDDEEEDDEEPNGSLKSTTFTTSVKDTTTLDSETGENGESIDSIEYTEILTEFTTVSPTSLDQKATDAPTEFEFDDEEVSRCCLDRPGFIYLVACVSPFEFLQVADFYTDVKDPPFDDRCIAIGSACGVSCGTAADAPVSNTCDENGQIPLKKLVRERFRPEEEEEEVEDADGEGRRRLGGNGNGRRHYDRRYQFSSWRASLYHYSFVFFVTLMAMGTWVSFFAGTGSIQEPLKPSMAEVEDYMAEDSKEDPNKKPLCLVAFSISASEPRMMVLRNMCGKLMSWVYQRKFTLSARSMAHVNPSEESEADSLKRKSHRLKAATMTEHVEFIDIFSDEGHRVGVYALWDAFVELVHDSDLLFIENMANKMNNMTATDDILLSKEKDDGLCLDDELRAMAADKPDAIRITKAQIDQFELAYATYDLLTALGHPAFWRTDELVNVIGFRDLASNPDACDALRLWAQRFKKERKLSGNPFAATCAPTNHKGIDQATWNRWWDLYDEIGRNQWVKRFDCTKFRRVRLHYDRDQNGGDYSHDLMMCYAARANPEDLKIKLGPTVLRRGIVNGVFVRLKEAGPSVTDKTAALYRKYLMQPLSRGDARRCHARVVSSNVRKKVNGKSCVMVKVKECTPDLLTVLPNAFLVNGGLDDDIEGADDAATDKLLKAEDKVADHLHQGEEALIPIELLQPLRESRGKSGGMNHAMEILNFYLRHHSSTMKVMKKNYEYERSLNKAFAIENEKRVMSLDDVPENSTKKETRACLLFAIFDCRHMATQGYWDVVVPYFYKYRNLNNPWSRGLAIDRPVAFVQLPQTFNSLTIDNDIFDMRNEYLFRLANNVRSGVGAITSCGTNAVWNYDLFFQQDPLEHRFNEDTMIEDTASSHDVIIAGRKGVYHFERLVLGARKGTTDYLAAVFRWSRGAVQLFWTTFWFPRYKYVWPWIVLVLHVGPIIACTIYLQTVKLDKCHQTPLTQRIGWVPCRSGAFLGLIADPVYVIYAIIMVSLASLSVSYHRLGAYVVMFENVTYFFSSISAFYWTSLPIYICIAKRGVPPVFDTQLLTLGALWLQLHSALLIHIIKSWSPLENGNAPSDQSLLRSQQMYIVTAPLHLLAMIFGMKDGFDICFRRKDASRWSSFDSIMAMTAVKMWVVVLFGTLCVSIVWGVVNGILYDNDIQERGVRGLGIFFCIMLLFLVWTPVRAMFFYEKVIKDKSKPSRLDRITAAICGKKQPIRFDYIYLLLWCALIFYTFSRKNLGDSEGVFNMRSRCSNDSNEPGCDDLELYSLTRVPGDGLAQ